MRQYITTLLGNVTMYRMMLYYLGTLLTAAVILGTLGYVPFSPVNIIVSTAYFIILCYIFNWFFSTLFRVKRNTESQFISALILASVVGPFSIATGGILLFVVALVAMASKYVLAYHKRHIVNPAAIGMLAAGLVFGIGSSWWVGNLYLFPIIVIGALLLLLKTERLAVASTFLGTFIIIQTVLLTVMRVPFFDALRNGLSIQMLAPLLFFASVMLIEPMTSPHERRTQYYYGSLVAVLFLGYSYVVISAPYALELALLSGNLFAFISIKNPRTVLLLKKKETIARDTVSYWFEPARKISFVPGQFMEWQLSHSNPDDRGIRRYFTICSSPTEKQIMLTTKFSTPSSTFKTALRGLHIGDSIDALHVGGMFTLPEDPDAPCICIAGGVGVTPFRSMIKYMLDKKISRPITLFYSNKTVEDIAFKDVFDEAIAQGWLKVVYTITEAAPYGWLGKMGYITSDMIKEEAPNYAGSIVYISGPQPMVAAFEKTVTDMGVPAGNIKVDYFPGYTETHQEK